jgi:hypothetical protein
MPVPSQRMGRFELLASALFSDVVDLLDNKYLDDIEDMAHDQNDFTEEQLDKFDRETEEQWNKAIDEITDKLAARVGRALINWSTSTSDRVVEHALPTPDEPVAQTVAPAAAVYL